MDAVPAGDGALHPAAVLFDMDGLLVETESLWYAAERDVVTRLGGPWAPQDSEALVGGPISRAVAYMIDVLGGGHDAAHITAALMRRMEDLLRSEPIHWRPGARELLLALRELGVPCALVSASWRALVDAVFDAVLHEVGPVFGASVAGDELERTKPYPDPYLHAAAALGLPAQRCVVLEDSPVGVAAGSSAGAFVVAVPTVSGIVAAPGVLIVESLTDVTPGLLGELSHTWVTSRALAELDAP